LFGFRYQLKHILKKEEKQFKVRFNNCVFHLQLR